MEGWNTTWPNMPNITPVDAHKSQEVMNSQRKLIIVKEFFLDISKQMLEISYILNFKQLLEIVLKLNISLAKVETRETQNISKTTTNKQVGYSILKVGIDVVVIDNHMAIIQVQIKKNTIEDVLLNGGFGVNQ
jgi:hypothetical protein